MKEKERYELIGYCSYRDTETGVIGDNFVELLNQQYKLIKELESEVKVGEFWHSGYQGKQLEYDMVYAELRQSYDEIEKLKQQLHDLPKKIVGEIRDVLNGNDVEIQDNIYLTDILDTILKKYGGEK